MAGDTSKSALEEPSQGSQKISHHRSAPGSARVDSQAHASSADQANLEIFHSLPQAAVLLEAHEGAVIAVNKAAAQLYGRPASEVKSVFDLCAAGEHEALRAFVQDPGDAGRKTTCGATRPDGTRLSLELACARVGGPDSTRRLILITNLTQRLRAEKEASVFSALGQTLSGSRSPREAARAVAGAAEALLGWDACIFERCSPDLRSIEMVLAMDTVNGRRVEVTASAGRPGPIAEQAIAKGPQLLLRGEVTSPGEPVLPFGDVSRLSRSIMAVPLLRNERPIGVLSVQSYTPNAYTEADLRTLASLAEHCAGAFGRLRAEDEIARLHTELRRHLEELQTLFDVAPVGIVVAHDTAGQKVTLNAACAAVLGLPPGTTLLENLGRKPLPFRVFRDGREIGLKDLPIYRAALTGLPEGLAEFEVWQPGGRKVHCLAAAAPLFDDSSHDPTHVRGSLGVVLDINDRKAAEREILRLNAELEQRVKDRTRQLELANRELESFSYSVSHDLRAPLRSIRGFSEVLLERYNDCLDARGQEFLKRACDSCLQMDRLIEDLLKLSRVNRSELQPDRVNLSAMATSILDELRKAEPGRAVEIVVPEALTAVADERLLRLAMENLLRNAWKFTRDEPGPRIEVGRMDGPEEVFFVRDNGAGFDMAYANKLFGVFQRLHSTSEFPGTGIGLATVQRVIRRHGGRVWAEGVVGEGASFYFTLSESGSS